MTYKPIMPYVKVHVHKLDDVRFLRLSPALIGRWTQLMILARKCDAGGAFVQNGKPMKVEDMALLFRCQEEDLLADIKALRQASLIHVNGKGWQLNDYENEQGPDDEVKRTYWRERQKLNREKKRGHVIDNIGHVNDSQAIESESESESELKTKSESDKTVSTTYQVLETLAIPVKYRSPILNRPGMTRDIILSAYAKAASEKEKDKRIKSPAALAGWKLAQGEDPEPIWHDQEIWRRSIPANMLTSLGVVIQETNEEEIQVTDNGYTQSVSEETFAPEIHRSTGYLIGSLTASECWKRAKDQLQVEMPKATFDTWVRDIYLTHWDRKTSTLTFSVRNTYTAEWLESRLTAKATRLLMGICNQDVKVVFTHPGEQQSGRGSHKEEQ